MSLIAATIRQLAPMKPAKRQPPRFSLWSATVRQVMSAKPWHFAATQRGAYVHDEGYYSNANTEARRKNREKVLQTLQEHGPLTVQELAKKIEGDAKATGATIGGLVKSKIAERLDDGRYRLTEKSHA